MFNPRLGILNVISIIYLRLQPNLFFKTILESVYLSKKKRFPSLNFIRLLRVVITPSVTSESTGR